METTRTQLLRLLSSLDIDYPSDTKLPDATLEKRLLCALDGVQCLNKTFPKLLFDPACLEPWKIPSKPPLFQVVQRSNLSGKLFPTQFSNDGAEHDDYGQAFNGLRQTLMQVAKYFDDEFRLVFAMDEEGKSGICFRNIEVRKVDSETPVFLVMYQCKASREAVRHWAEADSSPNDFRVPEIRASLPQQQLLLRILSANSRRISKSYQPKRNNASEKEFKTSFLLPVGPLHAEELGSFNRDTGCSVCGEKTTSRCSGCAIVSYCGQVCQKADWKSHKPLCRSLEGATWKTIKISPMPKSFTIINRHSHAKDIAADSEPLDRNLPPPNKHGANPFIIKLQNNNTSARSEMTGIGGIMSATLIYDMKRTFQVHLMKEVDRDGFETLLPVIAKGWMGMKVFCWARRVGDWELCVCLDRLPDQNIKW